MRIACIKYRRCAAQYNHLRLTALDSDLMSKLRQATAISSPALR